MTSATRERDERNPGSPGWDPQLPEISLSRTSTESKASKTSSKLERKRDSGSKSKVIHPPGKKNVYQINPHWRPPPRASQQWWRGTAPDLEWQYKWDDRRFQDGRVLIIDYISYEEANSPGNSRHIKIAAKECQNITELRHFYSDKKRVHGAALRVIHVQNAPWATLFLLHKFNMNHPSELVGMQGFNKWARYEKPRQHNGKPFPTGRSWRGQTDPWRNISRTAFGLDYLKVFESDAPNRRNPPTVFGDKPVDAKMMHLNSYEDSRSPYGHDISIQRLSVYVQRNIGPIKTKVSSAQGVKNPYLKSEVTSVGLGARDDDCKPYLEGLDNGNTVIVFETSASMLLEDCLIQPRNDFEKRWRRLSFYLRKEDVLNDSRLAAQCTNMILGDIFHGLSVIWDQFLGVASDHVAILEDKIYENPADESRAPELWTNQAAWLKVNKIMYIHQDLVKELQSHMKELADADDEDSGVEVEWLASSPAQYDRLAHSVTEDLVQPTDNLSDLMYKSVGIRDSRQSLQLALSMWRLSWITFIFLPLTFIVGFFGMNVNTFSNDPPIEWYFVSAIVLMIFGESYFNPTTPTRDDKERRYAHNITVLFLWYFVKHNLQRGRQSPYQRGLYEAIFNNLEKDHPDLWTSTGAAEGVEPVGFMNRQKWRLLRYWFAPERTVDQQMYSSLAPKAVSAELGAWAGFKRYLLYRWLGQIKFNTIPEENLDDEEAGTNTVLNNNTPKIETGTINELAKFSTPIAMADAEPAAIQPLATIGLRPLKVRDNGTPRNSEDRPSSASSGIIFEERNLSDSESDVAASDHHDGNDSNKSAP